MRVTIAATALLFCLTACDRSGPEPGGGGSAYTETLGSAVIRTISPPASGRVEFTFDFRPTDPAAAGEAKDAIESASVERAEKLALKVGSELPCVRMDRTKGTTSPLVWRFPDLEKR